MSAQLKQPHALAELLANRIAILDGAMGTMIKSDKISINIYSK